MKKYLFLLILFFSFPVFAKDVTNYIQYDTDNPTGTYKGDEIDLGGYNGKFDVKTRYNGKLSMIEFVLSSNYFDFNINTTYTITLNMATNDWRNNFMGPQVIKLNSNGSQQTTNGSLSVSNFQFVSRKSIKFNFKTNSTISPYLLFRLYSTDYASTNNTAITGDSNWNLSSIVITTASSSSGSGSSSSGSSSTGGSSTSGSTLTCNNGLILSSNIFNNTNVTTNNYYLNSSGTKVSDSNYGIVTMIPVSPHTTYYLNKSNNTDNSPSYCLGTSSNSYTICSSYNNRSSISFDTGNATYLFLSLKYGETIIVSSCVSSVDNQNQNTQQIIDNQNQNTTNIIENNNDNTQQIIDNQNQNANKCYQPHSEHPRFFGVSLTTNGYYTVSSRNSGGVIDVSKYQGKYINIIFSNLPQNSNTRANYCFGADNASEIQQICLGYNITSNNVFNKTYSNVLVPTNSKYLYLVGVAVRNDYTDWVNNVTIEFPEHCENRQDQTNEAIKDLNDNITNDNVDSDTGTGFFDDFESNDFGLSDIITIPLNTIQSLTSSSCVALNVPIPYTNESVSLPCMTQVYEQNIPTIYNLWKIVSFGIISYFIGIDIFHIVKGFKDPESDKVEVLDL